MLSNLEWYLKVLVYLLVAVFGLGSYLFMFLKNEKLYKSLFMCNVTTFVIVFIFLLLNFFGVFENLSDLEKVKSVILNSGASGIIICILLQLLQVVILPAPGWIFYLATTSIYGVFWGFVISYLCTVVGSIIAFSIGRIFGRKMVEWCIGKEDTEKYSNLLNKKDKFPFIMMQLLPFFPDDILCMVAGLSSMSYTFLTLTLILVKPFYILAVCLLGNANLLSFSGAGIFIWIGIFLVVIVLGILYYKFQDKIDDFFENKFFKRK
ncbi:MAG: TVP38/TMEM64 family protein [Clostridia bacterium]|nr:TVP38/TMEM64 family protein [Clostridia bacterium]